MATAPSLATIASRQQQRAIVHRILLADDQHEILEAVHSILSADAEFVVVGTAEDGMHAVELAMNLKPDVLVLDISMPVVNEIEAICRLKKAASHSRIVFLTVHTDPDFVDAALTAGALGYVLKAFIAAELVPALKAALYGEIFLSRRIIGHKWPKRSTSAAIQGAGFFVHSTALPKACDAVTFDTIVRVARVSRNSGVENLFQIMGISPGPDSTLSRSAV